MPGNVIVKKIMKFSWQNKFDYHDFTCHSGSAIMKPVKREIICC